MVTSLEQIKTSLQAFGPKWSEYLLVLMASWMIAGVFVGQDLVPTAKKVFISQTQKVVTTSHVDTNTLQKVHLFGKAEEQAKAKITTTPLVVKDSKLNIKLIGTVVAGARSAAVVTINVSKEHQVFFTGDQIQPGVTLQTVEVAAIVLMNNGQQERINIEEGKVIVSAPSVAKPKPARARPTRQVNRNINRRHMQKQLRNFSQLLSQARVTPHFTDKKADGFTISEIVKGSLYEQIGLVNGDVIRKVNGESVTGAEQAMRMYKELQSATNIDVEIMRGGNIQQVSYSIQ